MIEIKLVKDKVTVKGHANYAKTGGDIVCASISTLFQSLVLGVETLTKDEIDYQLKSGDSCLKFLDGFCKDSLLLVNSFLISSLAIAEEYPENVQVILGD